MRRRIIALTFASVVGAVGIATWLAYADLARTGSSCGIAGDPGGDRQSRCVGYAPGEGRAWDCGGL